tara:strand:- start:1383 stop:2159 length:777 start_codon:yes stop_codon:yes gene_type:complete
MPINLFQKRTIVVQPPPLFPQVKFVTENNSSKKIDIYLSETGGEMEDKFKAIYSSDRKQKIQLSQASLNDNGTITFKDLDDSSLYQVYKSLSPPKSYKDLTLETEIRMPFKTTSATFKDSVIPNQKVYYMFRKVNSKGLVSNPTAIYEVELLIDADDSKIIVNTHQFPKEIIEQSSQKFRNLFQIMPAVDQTFLDQDQEALINATSFKGKIDNIKLGTATESVWGRKFKFRFKSTMTGKIIDYNITFTLTKNKTEEDF